MWGITADSVPGPGDIIGCLLWVGQEDLSPEDIAAYVTYFCPVVACPQDICFLLGHAPPPPKASQSISGGRVLPTWTAGPELWCCPLRQ